MALKWLSTYQSCCSQKHLFLKIQAEIISNSYCSNLWNKVRIKKEHKGYFGNKEKKWHIEVTGCNGVIHLTSNAVATNILVFTLQMWPSLHGCYDDTVRRSARTFTCARCCWACETWTAVTPATVAIPMVVPAVTATETFWFEADCACRTFSWWSRRSRCWRSRCCCLL